MDESSLQDHPLLGCHACDRNRRLHYTIVVLLVLIIIVCIIDVILGALNTRLDHTINKICNAIVEGGC